MDKIKLSFEVKGQDVKVADKLMRKILKSLTLEELESIGDTKIEYSQNEITLSSDVFDEEETEL